LSRYLRTQRSRLPCRFPGGLTMSQRGSSQSDLTSAHHVRGFSRDACAFCSWRMSRATTRDIVSNGGAKFRLRSSLGVAVGDGLEGFTFLH